ncbi:MAG: hypothetical protein ACOY0R_00400 [Chloroflexota bacterium]
MTRNKVCNECGGRMRSGFVVGQENEANVPQNAMYWLEGPLRKEFYGLKTDRKKIHYVVAYRCEQCGFLKFYAGADPAAEPKE